MSNEENPLTLLVIEDTPGDARLIEEFIREKKENIKPFFAENLANALEALINKNFDLILTDLNLPDSKGINTFLKVKEHSSNTPIVILSSLTDREISLQALNQGAEDFLLKNTINPESLIRSIFYAIERQKNREDIKKSESQLKELLERDPYGILLVQDNKIEFANCAFSKLTALPIEKKLINESVESFIQSEDLPQFNNLLQVSENLKLIKKMETKLVGADGRTIDVLLTISPMTIHSKNAVEIIVQDITELKAVEFELRSLAYQDSLTGLTNRNLLFEKIKNAINFANRNKKNASIIMLDVDFFKKINETFSHYAGDRLLQEIANRLKEKVRSVDAIVKVEGDEFVIVCPEITNSKDVTVIATKLLSIFQNPFFILNHTVLVTASLGISIYPEHDTEIEKLLNDAEMAMFQAKRMGRNRYEIYNKSE